MFLVLNYGNLAAGGWGGVSRCQKKQMRIPREKEPPPKCVHNQVYSPCPRRVYEFARAAVTRYPRAAGTALGCLTDLKVGSPRSRVRRVGSF